jgi:eukaryotic-like serine/threonine-protein kinase
MTETGSIPVREGDLVAGKYRIEKAIGAGGMGIIVAARHEQLDQRVAIKFVRGETLGTEDGVQRFLREARAAVRLRSEHAARVLDVGTLESGEPYMVMEYLEGSDLGHVLTERGPVPVEVAAEWIAQACEALAEAHAAGIVHRDLKPQNLFLARTVGGADHVKVLDFGVSKSVDSLTGGAGALTRTSAILGSPLYMAPEQMRSSRDVDARADVWALGVVLFELLTRRWPFEADTLPALCLKVVGEPPQSLSELRPDVPPAAVALIERCLEKNPEHRFANAAELASALEPLLPVGSRAMAKRARMSTGGPPTAAHAGNSDKPRPTIASSGRAAPTPSAWGSRKGALASSRATRATALGLGALVAAVAGAGVLVLVLHARAPGDSAVSSQAPGVAPAIALSDPPRRPESAPPIATVVTLAPRPLETAATAASDAAAAAVPVPIPAVAPAPVRATAVWVPPADPKAGGAPAAVSASAPAKSPRDDDIPSLR